MIYFKRYKDAKDYAVKHNIKGSIWFDKERNMFYIISI